MKLPIMQQPCVATLPDGTQHLGRVTKAGINHQGVYRIAVYSLSWAYDREFAPDDVRLCQIPGFDYDAFTAFCHKYPREQRDAMEKAELQLIANNAPGTTTGCSSSAGVHTVNTPKTSSIRSSIGHARVPSMAPKVHTAQRVVRTRG